MNFSVPLTFWRAKSEIHSEENVSDPIIPHSLKIKSAWAAAKFVRHLHVNVFIITQSETKQIEIYFPLYQILD